MAYMEGDLRPGSSTAYVTFGGDLVLSLVTRVEIELGGILAGDDYDVLDINGTVALDGTLDVTLIERFLPELGNTFQIMCFGSAVGDFAQYDGLDLDGGLVLVPSLLSDSLVLTTALAGDLNGDGFVGGDDLDIVRSYWGQTATPGNRLHGDVSGDGFVGRDDLDMVRAQWGEGTPPGPAEVPEPATSVLLTLGWATWMATGLRRR